MITKHKSGQAALIIVIVTMVTALGVAVSSITQSNLNLKETVYSTQATQAKACAEAGAERALAFLATDPTLTGGTPPIVNQLSTDVDAGGRPIYAIDGCTYTTTIRDYPCTGGTPSSCNGDVYIASLAENAVQEIKVKSGSSDVINIKFTTSNIPEASLAVYLYKASSVDRQMYHCGSNSSPSADFTNLTPDANGDCSTGNISTTGVTLVRLRPLYTSMSINVSGNGVSGTKSGYLIESKGSAGSVTRSVNVYRFLSQLPAAFDEAVVSLGTGELN